MAKATEEMTTTDDSAAKDKARQDDRAALQALPDGERVQIMITVPKEFKLLLLDKADETDVPLARFVRETLANMYDFTLPANTRTRAKKYATEEERVAAQKANAKKRNDIVKKLLAAYNAGEIDLEALTEDDDDDTDDDE